MSGDNRSQPTTETAHTPTPWIKGATFSTHNHPTRFWETDVCRWTQDPRGAILIAHTAGATKEETEELADLIVEAVNSHAALEARIAELESDLHEADCVIDALSKTLPSQFQKELAEKSARITELEKLVEEQGQEIAITRERDEGLEGALQPFANLANGYDDDIDSDDRPVGPVALKFCRIARAALSHAGPVARDGER